MATINYDFYDNKDIYNDGSVEKDLLEYYRDGKDLDFSREDIFYLTDDIRTNILNWYPFTKKDDVLEIGCGCGTITELLCNNCKTVTCIEGSKRRAEITYHRHIQRDNLDIFAGNFENVQFNKKYDYIILIGVFEYAKRFFENDQPFHFFLNKIKSLLKPNGKVLIAIENRYGLKYWAGGNEDHIVAPYVGLEGYDNYDVQTFGKQEFVNLIQDVGFTNYKFYYPFPDYKMTSIVYTDERLPKNDEIMSVPFFLYGKNINFDVHRVLSGIIDNNEFGFFSNSFLIEFGTKQSKMSNVVFSKNSVTRNDEYQITTIQTSDNKFFKKAKYSNKHLDSLLDNHTELSKLGIKSSKIIKTNDIYESEYIVGENTANIFKKLIDHNDIKGIINEFDNVVNYYNGISVLKKLSNPIIPDLNKAYPDKTYVLKMSLIDGNVSNLIKNKNGEYVLIDQEWVDCSEIPADYLIYNSIMYLYGVNYRLNNLIKIDEILKKYDFNGKKIDALRAINDVYYQENNILNPLKCSIVNNCSRLLNNTKIDDYCVLYYDDGSGFNENNKIVKKYTSDFNSDVYCVSFSLDKKTKCVRFDPLIKGCRFVKLSSILVNNKLIKYDKFNFVDYKNGSLLISEHPFIVFKNTSSTINICVKMEELSKVDEQLYLAELISKNNDIDNQLKIEKDEKEKVLKDLNETKTVLNSIVNSKSWKLLNKIRRVVFRKK